MITRRAFLKATGALTLAGWTVLPNRFMATLGQETPGFEPDLDVVLAAVEAAHPIFAGNATRTWSYQGEILTGRSDALVNDPDSYLGPTFRVRQGERVRIRFRNQIPEESIIHWHGLRTPPAMDGHPRDVVGPGGEYVYEFTVLDRAGTYWYHPHPHRRTGPQVYYGLAGLFLVSDPQEESLGLPAGPYDLPLVLQDRTFDAANQFLYLTSPMEQMTGFLGEEILVNGRPEANFEVEARPYRLRLLNGSNARIYRLAWADGRPLTVIASDGGLLERPMEKPYILLGPGERVEVWADFSLDAVGIERRLVSLPTLTGGGMGGGMGPGMMAGAAPFDLATLRIARATGSSGNPLPAQLSTIPWYQPSEAVNAADPRQFRLLMRQMTWTINGRTFEMETVAADERVRFGDLEAWEFVNSGGGMGGMIMPHPMHLHGVQFQVAERLGSPYPAGLIDEGWKDTVLVMPGERVRIMVEFRDYAGLYLYHCHNLEHEDMGMMRNYLIES
jgi:FtsP/CotA-like multicopper oxidase with cupredoxin domain